MQKVFFYFFPLSLCTYALSSIEGKDLIGRRNEALQAIRKFSLFPEGKDQAHLRENTQPPRKRLLEVIKESYKKHTF